MKPLPVVFDTNVVIAHIRRQELLPAQAVLPVIVVGELQAIALKSNWGAQRVSFLDFLCREYPVIEIVAELADLYARIDAYSQGKLLGQPLPRGMSARNMGKNDLWIATTAFYLDMPLHTADNDFDHLPLFGLQLVKERL